MKWKLFLYCSVFLSSFAFAEAVKAKNINICMPVRKEELVMAAMMAAEEKGYFREQGIDDSLKFIFTDWKTPSKDLLATDNAGNAAMPRFLWTNSEVAQKLAKGEECDFAFLSIDSILMTGLDTSKVKPLLFHLYGRDYDTHLVVAKDSPIQSIKDLKGKKIRVSEIPNQIAALNILKEAGLTAKDVTFVYNIPLIDVAAKLASGDIDATISYNPTMALLLASNKVRILRKNVMSNYVKPFVPHGIFAANAAFAEKNPEIATRVTKAVQRGGDYINKNPSELVYLYRKYGEKLQWGTTIWIATTAEIERASSLIGTISFVGMNEKIKVSGKNNDERLSILSIIDRYQSNVMQYGFFKKKLSFDSWKKYTNQQQALR